MNTKRILSVSYLFLILFSWRTEAYYPLLVGVLMVKNEADCIEKTLEPLADGGIRDFFILDTGSNDGTPEIIKNFFKRKGVVRGYVEQEPFIDFATSRNRTLELAEKKFPSATFMLMLDANWYVQNVPAMLDFCREKLNSTEPSYLVRVVDYGTGFPSPYRSMRIFRCTKHVRYKGVVHEYVDKTSPVTVPDSVRIDQIPGKNGQQKSAVRHNRDKELLSKEVEKNPQDSRSLYYLAQTYSCLGDWENARKYYALRIQIDGYLEEKYLAMYRLGIITNLLYEQKKMYSWSEAMDYFLKAHEMRPWRAEPLVCIAQHYMEQNDRATAFLFAHRAMNLPFPQYDNEVVDADIYNFIRYDVVGISAWNVGEYEIGEKAVRKALEVKPDVPHLHKNLALYLERKAMMQGSLNQTAPTAPAKS